MNYIIPYFYTLGGLLVSSEVFRFIVGLAAVVVIAGLLRLMP